MKNGMEQKIWYGIYKMPEWNEMEDFKNKIEDNLPYFHTNFILNRVGGRVAIALVYLHGAR